jgi:hypothetical protein
VNGHRVGSEHDRRCQRSAALHTKETRREVLEGWAEPEEWREFTRGLARSLGVEARLDGTV